MSTAMTEFKITTDLSVLRRNVIEANFTEVKDWLEENLAPYQSMTVTADMISTAKAYRATIRKVADRIDQSRKEAKASALAAYTDFETKCKDLTGLCANAAGSLDAQIKAFEDAEREEKIAAIRAVYDEGDEDVKVYCPWERIFNPKWGNKGYGLEEAKEEVRAALCNTEANIGSIRSMDTSDTAYLLDVYKSTGDMGMVLRKFSELDALRKREEQRRAEEERRRELARQAEEKRATPVEESASVKVPQGGESDPVVTVTFQVTGRKSDIVALGVYMRQHGLNYRRP